MAPPAKAKGSNKDESGSDEEVQNLDLTVLIHRKQRMFEQMQKLFDMSRAISNSDSKDLFLMCASEIDELRSSFESAIFNILEKELEDDPKASPRSSELKSFDDLYFRVKLCVSKCRPSDPSIKAETPSKAVESRPRLPKLELFTFDGNIENFNTFFETFCSLVHNQTSIPKIDKFHYLLSCTKGAALNIVKSVPISANNYELVWKSLLDKYQDHRMLVGRYLDKMLSFSPLQKESSDNLNSFIENFDHSYKAIEALNVDDLSSYVMCHIALRALDPFTRKCFEQKLDQKTIPTFDDLITFVQNHIKVLDHSSSYSASSSVQQTNQRKFTAPRQGKNNYSHASSSNIKFTCLHCGENHMIFRCDQFRNLTNVQRMSRANDLKLCHNCLKPNHTSKECKSEFKCYVCKQPHHVLLHRESSDSASKPVYYSETAASEQSPSNTHAPALISNNHLASTHNYAVILGTAVVHILDSFNNYQTCRVLIDSGAQSNFMTLDCFQRLGLSAQKCPYNIYGLGGENVKTNGMVSCTIKPRHSASPCFDLNAVILSRLTSDLPTVQIPNNVIHHFKDLELADPWFYKKAPIDIILAADIFPHIYDGKKCIVSPDVPIALGSVFGYVVTGRLEMQSSSNNCHVVASTTSLVSYTIEENSLNETLKRFWEVEASPCEVPIDPLEELAERIYVEQHSRDEIGRYVSPILLNPEHKPLGDSYETALKRLTQVERRLARSPDLRKAYVDFMKEYESLGHMEPYQGTEPSGYFIPHHCVLRPSSTTTPLRVVYDGSAKTTSGASLNDALLTGRKLHQDILKIIINFRLYDVCFTADVSKMYRAVIINPVDRKYQHILWRDHPTEPVRTFELTRNTYGLRSAPFVAVRTLHQLAADELARNEQPISNSHQLASGELVRTEQPRTKAAEILKGGCYVDDVLWSCQSQEEACMLQDDLTALLKSGGFDLRKWASNCPQLLTRMQSDQVTAINFQDDTLSSSLKVLGLTWLPSCDSFSFNYNLTDTKQTKRSVLKLLASIFDPVGFISPCTFIAKCIMQDLWKLGLGWDDPLPSDLTSQWNTFITELSALGSLRIERHVLISNFNEVQLIAFCDASSRGYAACVYLRSVDRNGHVKVRLLTSKSKVAPLNPILSIPRLELEAAVLLSKLVSFVVQNLNDFKVSIIALGDSNNVLAWLQTPPYKLKTFVANRVSQVTTVVPSHCWFHVNSENNAADICSRGAMPARFVGSAAEWVHGPEWLYEDQQKWPIKAFYVKDGSKIIEMKSNCDTFVLSSCDDKNIILKNNLEETFNKFSSFTRLQRVMAWCHRFVSNLKSKKSARSDGPLRSFELKTAHLTIIRVVQVNHFYDEIALLQQNKYVTSLRKLSPFVDSHEFLRVGGRLVQSDLPYNMKHPVLLPKCHTIKLIIEYFHRLYLHVGPRTLQGILCKNYWIVNARSIIRSVLSKCKICFRCRPSSIQPAMGPLPAPRLKPDKVFNHVGCDLGGPFFVKESLRRNAKVYKSYLCLFVCFSTKAVHLEVLTDLSCDCFLAAFDRFVARRGLCSCVYSDCGTNFIAAAKHLKEVVNFLNNKDNQDKIINGLTTRHVEWRNNPPNAASMGGLWEAGIKSAKHHLNRVVGDRSLTFEELSTVFCRVEAVLNSRPLCSLSDNPNEFEVLTAGHFLIGQCLLAVPEYDFDDVSQNRLSRWQSIQKVSQSFWRRWSDDYLHTLQQRAKWFQSPPNLNVGDLVLLKSNLTRPLQWNLARIDKVHSGVDKVNRVLTLRTKTGLIQRPTNKVCPLPYVN